MYELYEIKKKEKEGEQEYSVDETRGWMDGTMAHLLQPSHVAPRLSSLRRFV